METEGGRGLCADCGLHGVVGQAGGIEAHVTRSWAPGEPGVGLATLALNDEAEPRVELTAADAWVACSGLAAEGQSSGAEPGSRGDRYELLGEIARGGMGAVLRGRDRDLGRDLAVKVLLEGHQGKPELVRRFVEEAQIGGQLQHPGVVPVYELGAFADRRPYFTMKLVKGRTLAALLQERADARVDLPRFLSIFESVAQTVAYAHARGVIHRDLKPSNVMVGAFGEVQVMDWGLAKVLREDGGESGGEEKRACVDTSVIQTVRSGSTVEESRAGSVLGTPAYMSPEQAKGDVDAVDRRSDVFGLGSILCEILTGKAAYVGKTWSDVLERAAYADTAEAFARLTSCGADAELVGLVRDCLAADAVERPSDAGVVAGRVTAYLAGVQERLREAELARVEERGRRRVTTVAAAAAILLFGFGSGGYVWVQQQRAERVARAARGVDESLARAERLRGEALAAPEGETVPWATALAVAEQAEALARQGDIDVGRREHALALRGELAARLAASTARAELLASDRALLLQLELIRGRAADLGSSKAADDEYAAAFRAAGLDVDRVDPAVSARWLGGRTEPVELASYLDDWAEARRLAGGREEAWAKLIEVARAADPDPWRDTLRAQAGQEGDLAGDVLRRLAKDEVGLDAQPAASLVLLVRHVQQRLGDFDLAERVARRAWQRHAGDFWVNLELGDVLKNKRSKRGVVGSFEVDDDGRMKASLVLSRGDSTVKAADGQWEEALRYFAAAVAIRPTSPTARFVWGELLGEVGDIAGAEASYREAIRLKPDYTWAYHNLGNLLKAKGDRQGAIAALREAVRLKPEFPFGRLSLSSALGDSGDLEGALLELRKAVELAPENGVIYNNLCVLLREMGDNEGAVEAGRNATRHSPELAEGHYNLGNALVGVGQPEEALVEFREALRIDPAYAAAYGGLGEALASLGKFDEAIAACQEALELEPKGAEHHAVLGTVLGKQGDLAGSIGAYREAVRLKPGYEKIHYNLGAALMKARDLEGALEATREALRLAPKRAEAHSNLGAILYELGDLEGALAASREAVRLKPDHAIAHVNLASALKDSGDVRAALEAVREGVRLAPGDGRNQMVLGDVLRALGRGQEALAAYRESLRLDPNHSPAHNNYGAALRELGDMDGAVRAFREAIRVDPTNASAHSNLGVYLFQSGDRAGAMKALQESLRHKPDSPQAIANLGLVLCAEGRLEEGLAELKRARELDRKNPVRKLAGIEQLIAMAEAELAHVDRLKLVAGGEVEPASAEEAIGLANLSYQRGLFRLGVRLFERAFELDAALADDLRSNHRYNAACCAALAGCGKGEDEPPADDAAKARYREQARGWLELDLAAWERILDAQGDPKRATLVPTLAHWKQDVDLAGVRDGALAELPEDERKAWVAIWEGVERLLEKSGAR